MLIIFAVLIGGILLGRLLLNRDMRVLPSVISVIIWALLFLLGIEVGSNPEVISNLGTIGVQSLLIAIFSSVGSILMAWLLWVYIKRSRGRKDYEG